MGLIAQNTEVEQKILSIRDELAALDKKQEELRATVNNLSQEQGSLSLLKETSFGEVKYKVYLTPRKGALSYLHSNGNWYEFAIIGYFTETKNVCWNTPDRYRSLNDLAAIQWAVNQFVAEQ